MKNYITEYHREENNEDNHLTKDGRNRLKQRWEKETIDLREINVWNQGEKGIKEEIEWFWDEK